MPDRKGWLSYWWRSLLDLVYLDSSSCKLCRRSLLTGFKRPVFVDFCSECRSEVKSWPAGVVSCCCCGRFYHGLTGEVLCPECRVSPLPLAATSVVGPYAGRLRQAIHLFKFRGRVELARPLGSLLAEVVRPVVGEGEIDSMLVLPVPLHRERIAARGFNQAELLARNVVRELKSPEYRIDVLERALETPPQTGLTRPQRQINLAGAFRINEHSAGEITGRPILLIDDIITTGSTSGECARTLLGAGSGPVILGVLAAGIVDKKKEYLEKP